MTPPRRSPPIPASIGLFFGGLWGYSGAMATPPPLRMPATALSVLVTVALIVLLWRSPPVYRGGPGLFRRRIYYVAVALEVVAIYAATMALARVGLTAFLIPAVGAIVGLHFTGLWRATGDSQFLWIAGAMCAVSAVAVLLPAGVATPLGAMSPRQAMTGFGDALVLWGFAGRSSLPGPRPN